MKILIVDDSKAMQSIVTKALKEVGFDHAEFLYGSNGEEGLKLASEQQPTLALCDLHMPGMSGIELVEAITREGLPTTTGIISIENKQDYIDAAKMAGASFFLQKPFTNKVLFDTITNAVKINPFRLERNNTAEALIIPGQGVLEALFTHLCHEQVKLQPAKIADFDDDRLPFFICSFTNDAQQWRAHFGADRRVANFIAVKTGRISAQRAVGQLAAATLDKPTQEACQSAMQLLTLLLYAVQPAEPLHANDLYVTESTAETALRTQKTLRKLEQGLQLYKLTGVAPEYDGGVFAIGPM